MMKLLLMIAAMAMATPALAMAKAPNLYTAEAYCRNVAGLPLTANLITNDNPAYEDEGHSGAQLRIMRYNSCMSSLIG